MKRILVAAAMLFSAEALALDRVETRWGDLSVRGERLAVRGKPFAETGAPASLSPRPVYRVGNRDLVLVEQPGGTMCPLRFRIAAVSRKGAKLSEEFGNCSEALEVEATRGGLRMVQEPWDRSGAPDVFVYDAAANRVRRQD